MRLRTGKAYSWPAKRKYAFNQEKRISGNIGAKYASLQMKAYFMFLLPKSVFSIFEGVFCFFVGQNTFLLLGDVFPPQTAQNTL